MNKIQLVMFITLLTVSSSIFAWGHKATATAPITANIVPPWWTDAASFELPPPGETILGSDVFGKKYTATTTEEGKIIETTITYE